MHFIIPFFGDGAYSGHDSVMPQLLGEGEVENSEHVPHSNLLRRCFSNIYSK